MPTHCSRLSHIWIGAGGRFQAASCFGPDTTTTITVMTSKCKCKCTSEAHGAGAPKISPSLCDNLQEESSQLSSRDYLYSVTSASLMNLSGRPACCFFICISSAWVCPIELTDLRRVAPIGKTGYSVGLSIFAQTHSKAFSASASIIPSNFNHFVHVPTTSSFDQ